MKVKKVAACIAIVLINKQKAKKKVHLGKTVDNAPSSIQCCRKNILTLLTVNEWLCCGAARIGYNFGLMDRLRRILGTREFQLHIQIIDLKI